MSAALRAGARIAAVTAAAGSVALMLHVGYRNGASIPFILLIFFTIWVVSPFVGLLHADLAPRRPPVGSRAWLHGVTLLIALVSLVIYGFFALGPPRPKPASIFLLVPLGSWVLFTMVQAGRRSKDD
jgi:hypothetical protein